MGFDTVLVRYGEIGLKSRNTRKIFIDRLISNIVFALKQANVNYDEVRRSESRVFVDTQDEKAFDVIGKVFGVVSFSPVKVCEPNMDSITKAAVQYSKEKLDSTKTFAVRPRRSGGQEFDSREIGKVVGDAVREATKSGVNLDNPDVEIHVEVREKNAYIFDTIHDGPGGLPLGIEGKVVGLYSGGIDSPVAIWLTAKRGCKPIFVYGYNEPFTDETNLERAKDVAKLLKPWFGEIKMYQVSHGENLKEFQEASPKDTCILCKRMLYRVANEIAKRENAKAIVTGESLGQVASQTLENILVLDDASELPVLRPAIGMDKTEIEDLSRYIGIYERSSKSATGCTAVPDQPSTAAKLEKILEIEPKLDIKEMLGRTMSTAKLVRI
jgi:thiamine biosynthesis protein ThiI